MGFYVLSFLKKKKKIGLHVEIAAPDSQGFPESHVILSSLLQNKWCSLELLLSCVCPRPYPAGVRGAAANQGLGPCILLRRAGFGSVDPVQGSLIPVPWPRCFLAEEGACAGFSLVGGLWR